MDYFLGIDLGTSSMKLLLVDGLGNVKRELSKNYPLLFPADGWCEQRPEDWRDALFSALPSFLSEEEKKNLRGIGIAGQMHGLVALDENFLSLRPAILWNDNRTEKETSFLNASIGKETLKEETSNLAFPGFTAPKLLWMKEHEPEKFQRIRKILLPKDYLVYLLTGVFSTDYSDASGTLLLNVEKKVWSKKMLTLCGIEENQLPTLYESYAPVGTLLPSLAKNFGLPSSVLVCAGAGDNAAAAVGTGTVGNGKCNLSLGTSGTLFLSSSRFLSDPSGAIHSFAHADGSWCLLGCILSAASAFGWWTEKILNTSDLAGEQKKISPDALGTGHLFFLPYLMGERSPLNDPFARGAFLGLSLDTTREEMTLAVLEGVAFAFRDCFEEAGLPSLPRASLCGGGAKSPLWRKILSSVLSLTLTLPEKEQGPGYGAALLSMVCCGKFSSVEEACQSLVSFSSQEEPNPLLVSRYEEKYRKFKEIYPSMKSLFPRLL